MTKFEGQLISIHNQNSKQALICFLFFYDLYIRRGQIETTATCRYGKLFRLNAGAVCTCQMVVGCHLCGVFIPTFCARRR